jgi:2-haloacid dehalogenase
MMKQFDTVIFDLGGVLIDWNPRYLYRKIFNTEEEVSWFLENICTPEWNDQQDAGRSFGEATEALVKQHPHHEEAIRAWYGRWQETIRGPLHDTVSILREVKDKNQHRLYALTNWSAETFPWALSTFEFLHWFEGIVVSGVEKMRKPFPEFYSILFERYGVDPTRAVFIDDNIKNIEGGRAVGLHTLHFQSPGKLREDLKALKIFERHNTMSFT